MFKQFKEAAEEKLKHFWDKHICANMPPELQVLDEYLDRKESLFFRNGLNLK